MKLKFTLLLIICVSFIISCKKDVVDGITPDLNYDIVNLNINGKQYDESRSVNIHFLYDNQSMCDTKKGVKEAIAVQAPDSRFSMSLFLLYRRLNSDFKTSSIGNYSVSNLINFPSDYGPCNLHLFLVLYDNSKKATLTSGTHSVKKITLLKTSTTYSDYLIEGEFSTIHLNDSNTQIPVSGTYKKVIQVFNQ